jgi:hypothetical protein
MFSTCKSANTTPLLNRTRRTICLYNNAIYYNTAEMMLINTTQVINYDTDITKRTIYFTSHKSSELDNEKFLIGGTNLSLLYTARIASNLLFLGHYAKSLTLLTTSSILSYSTKLYYTLKFEHNRSDIFTLQTAAQTYVYSVQQNVKLLSYNTTSATFLDIANQINLIYSSKASIYSVALLSHSSSTIKHKNNTQIINYGGDNTFYSLKGFFNYFRYKYQSLMSTNYHILIGNEAINMYNSSMQCLESHKAGYKKVTVDANFLKDNDGHFHTNLNLPSLFYENKVAIFYNGKLYTYDFDSITFSSLPYYNLNNSIDLETRMVSIGMDSVYKMPYISSYSSAVNQRITPDEEFWNLLQIDNIKDLQNVAMSNDLLYDSVVITPTIYYTSKLILRHNDIFIIQAYKGETFKSIIYVNCIEVNDTSVKEILTYNGSDILYSEYPYLFYSRYGSNFKSDSIYDGIIKLNLESMDYELITIAHYNCLITEYNKSYWYLYKDINGAYYLVKNTDLDKKINLSIRLNLSVDIVEFKLFDNNLAYFITTNKKVYCLNVITLANSVITTIGTPIIMIKFNNAYGCVLTRKDTYMFFEELQPIEWSTNVSNWITPQDMVTGEPLLPYNLYTSVLHKRSAPITSVYNLNVVERTSNVIVEKETGLIVELFSNVGLESTCPVRAGKCAQSVYSEVNMANINPVETVMSNVQYSKFLEYTKELLVDGRFKIDIKPLPFPETLNTGYKFYVK